MTLTRMSLRAKRSNLCFIPQNNKFKIILKQLQELTKNVKQIKKEIQKIERKLEE